MKGTHQSSAAAANRHSASPARVAGQRSNCGGGDVSPAASSAVSVAGASSPGVRRPSKKEVLLPTAIDSLHHEMYPTKGIDGAAPAHDYHFI